MVDTRDRDEADPRVLQLGQAPPRAPGGPTRSPGASARSSGIFKRVHALLARGGRRLVLPRGAGRGPRSASCWEHPASRPPARGGEPGRRGGGANIAVSGLAAAAGIGDAHPRAADRLAARRLDAAAVGGRRGRGGLAVGAVPATPSGSGSASTLLVFGLDLLRPQTQPARSRPADRRPIRRRRARRRCDRLARRARSGSSWARCALPALLRWVGEDRRRAVGDESRVGFAVGAAGLAGHVPGGVDWTLLWSARRLGAGSAARRAPRLATHSRRRGILLVAARRDPASAPVTATRNHRCDRRRRALVVGIDDEASASATSHS